MTTAQPPMQGYRPEPVFKTVTIGERPVTHEGQRKSLLLDNYKTLVQGSGQLPSLTKDPLTKKPSMAGLQTMSTTNKIGSNAHIKEILSQKSLSVSHKSLNRYATVQKLPEKSSALKTALKVKEPQPLHLVASRSQANFQQTTPQGLEAGHTDTKSALKSIASIQRQSFEKLPRTRAISSVTKSQSTSQINRVRNTLGKDGGKREPLTSEKKLIMQSTDSLQVVGKKEPLATLEVESSATKNRFSLLSEKGAKREKGSFSVTNFSRMNPFEFNHVGCNYEVVARDHKYEIKHGLKFGEFGYKRPPSGYMQEVIKRAKSSVGPVKYNHQVDWKKRSKDEHGIILDKAKRETLADKMFSEKKGIPGPSNYDNRGLKPKIHGFYKNSEIKCSVLGSTAFEKKFIPGPNAYESRGKAMSQILDEKAKAFLYHYKPGPKPKSYCKVKKTNAPAPTTYEVPEAKEHASEMRASIKNSIPKSKNANFLSTVMKSKKHIPGAGSYKTLETYKQLATLPTSLKIRRH